MLVFEERGNRSTRRKTSRCRVENQQNSTHIRRRVWESNPGHIGGRRVLSPQRYPCTPLRSPQYTHPRAETRLQMFNIAASDLNWLNRFFRRMDSIKQYMEHHKVPDTLQTRVKRWAHYAWSRYAHDSNTNNITERESSSFQRGRVPPPPPPGIREFNLTFVPLSWEWDLQILLCL